ncbi:Nif3-like dinuclear metal center hexameric protein [Clostridium cochlearium]|uniref:Nif3-like dinuclear metal center hexameric protein n=1 Tax=Clostridium cochlearium TaxID=1494 RepID=UPI000BBBDD1D|nr:Nif3-like dinuclear metal center hexameric protein [Clostridium cochlearium]MBE6064597.1 Nif3-like dinuclear metal center hexameric protein [Clostridium cochlearium]
MSLKLKEIIEIIENEYAPLDFKLDFDNVGLMVGDVNENINSILVALDCTIRVIEEAKKLGCNLIITHHPILFKSPKSITTDTLLGKKIIELIKSNINVYSSHTNLDAVPEGINEIVMNVLGFKDYSIIEKNSMDFKGEEVGIGRIVELEKEITLEELCYKVKNSLSIENLRYAGEDNQLIKKIAVINGSGTDLLDSAKRLGTDCVITGDTTYHYVSDYAEEGIAIIDAGHFETEWPSMKVIAKRLEKKLNSIDKNIKLYISEESFSPYKYK